MLFRLTRPDDWGLALFTIIYLKKRQKTTATKKSKQTNKNKREKKKLIAADNQTD